MRRVPFFVFSAIIFFSVAAIRIVWLQVIPAVLDGYTWMILAIHWSGLFALGFWNGRIALARARDAYGDGRYAVLGFIPLANLALVFKRSLTPDSADKVATIRAFRGPVGVLVGIVIFFAASLVFQSVKQALERQERPPETDTAALQRLVEVSLRLHGLEATLQGLVSGTSLPMKVDETTALTRVAADGTRLRRTFTIDTGFSDVEDQDPEGLDADSLAALKDDLRSEIAQAVCSTPQFVPLLRAGASIHEAYVGSDGTPIVFRTVTREVCGL